MGSKQSVTDGHWSSVADLCDGMSAYALSLTTSNATVALAAGQYLISTTGTDGAAFVVMRLASGTSDPTAPTNGGGAATDVCVWKATSTERMVVKSDALTLNAKLTTGSATLYLQKLA